MRLLEVGIVPCAGELCVCSGTGELDSWAAMAQGNCLTEKTLNFITNSYLVVLTATLSFWLCMPCNAHDAEVNRTKTSARDLQVVQIVLGNVVGDWGYEPLQALSKALVSNAKSRFLRVTWNCDGLSLSSSITALYDRHLKTIFYYCSGGHNMGGNPSEVVYAHYLYTGVTEEIVTQASVSLKCRDQGTVSPPPRPYPDAFRKAPTYYGSGSPGGYYDELLAFGCQRQKLP